MFDHLLFLDAATLQGVAHHTAKSSHPSWLMDDLSWLMDDSSCLISHGRMTHGWWMFCHSWSFMVDRWSLMSNRWSLVADLSWLMNDLSWLISHYWWMISCSCWTVSHMWHLMNTSERIFVRWHRTIFEPSILLISHSVFIPYSPLLPNFTKQLVWRKYLFLQKVSVIFLLISFKVKRKSTYLKI